MINNGPKVTIVIPVYNGANYVKYAIDSALAQTYQNIEILVINDGSSDSTEEILKSYGDKIKFITKENGGVSSALNLAINKMTGEYFSWLSHDDLYEPDKIEIEINYLKQHKLLNKKVILYSDYKLIDKNGTDISNCVKDHNELAQKPEYALLKGNINGLTLLIPKQAFDECGEFDTKLKCTQDYELWRLMSKKYEFIHIQKILACTRYHAKQVSNTSPLVVSEGNELYMRLINDVPTKRRIELEGSEYCFYKELEKFFHATPYKKIEQYCINQAQDIFNKITKHDIEKNTVSVVIPFFNRTKETIRAIKSVQNQTHQNFEIILVDDGSTVNQQELYDFAQSDKRIKILKNKVNSGPSIARNKGIHEAKGEYIAFLDSDDEFKNNKLEIMLHYALASNANFLHSSYDRETQHQIETISSGLDDGHCERKLMHDCTIATPTVMLKTQWVKTNHYNFNEDMQIGEDVCLWLQIMKNNTYLIGVLEPLVIVHNHDDASAFSIQKQIIGFKNIIRFLLDDTYYSQFDKELSMIMKAYVYNASKCYQDLSDKGIFYRLFYILKHEGAKNTSKRISAKIKKIFR